MYKVLIADDEKLIRKGLCSIIDWNAFGFEICAEASNGAEALSLILMNKPELTIIDIRMPKTTGLEAIRRSREYDFDGEFIVLSGYSDFEYAKEAIAYNVFSYLTKPVDTDELEKALINLKAKLDEKAIKSTYETLYKSKAKNTLLGDYLTGKTDYIDRELLKSPSNEQYQVILYERYKYNSASDVSLPDILHFDSHDYDYFDFCEYNNLKILVAKGSPAISKINNLISKFEKELPPEENSPLYSVFMACGNTVNDLHGLRSSFNAAKQLFDSRFFCDPNQHILLPYNMPRLNDSLKNISEPEIKQKYINLFVNNIQAYNRNNIAKSLNELKGVLFYSSFDTTKLKKLLIDIYLGIKEKITYHYSKTDIAFLPNSEIISTIWESSYLYEIISFFSEQFEMIINSIGYSSRDSIIDDIVHYISHNYADNITLENIAPLFGYNSSYLGKIFNQKMNCNFNSYLDSIRIEQSKDLLMSGKLQVYKIAEMVGYRNVDYFHIKFKKHTGMSPAEFRKRGSLMQS